MTFSIYGKGFSFCQRKTRRGGCYESKHCLANFTPITDDALALGREIGGKEGFLVGISSAAAIYGAIEVAKKLGTGKKVLALAPDNGERYLSTALYEFEV